MKSTERVLVVDHDTPTRIALRDVLEAHGFTVHVEERGEPVIAAVERAAFDAVVLDKELPDIGGLDLLYFLRHRCPATPIVLTTACGGDLAEAVALGSGAAAYLEKPVEPRELVTTLCNLKQRRLPRAGRAVSPIARNGHEPALGGEGDLWAVVPAGGHGSRLRSVTRRIRRERRLQPDPGTGGPTSLLRQALDRAALRVRAERTVVPAMRRHCRYIDAELGAPRPRVIFQPRDRGTAADVLLPTYWIRWRDPAATVVVLPSDLLVSDPRQFMDHVGEAVEFVGRYPRWMALLGTAPAGLETGYGCIIPGPVLDCTARGPVWRVERCVGTPLTETARRCRAAGGFASTGVVVARASTLVDAARQFLPVLHSRLVLLAPLIGSRVEKAALRRTYAVIPSVNFSRAILEASTSIMAVTRLTGVDWCDLGGLPRVAAAARRSGVVSPARVRGQELQPLTIPE